MTKYAILFFFLIPFSGQAQNIDYNRIVVPENVSVNDVAERLVQIAWRNHPVNDLYEYQGQVAEEHLKQARSSWLNILGAQVNINEFNLNQEGNNGVDQNMFYPLYNVGARINLGDLFIIPSKVRASKTEMELAEANMNARKLEIRQAVLTTYQDYLMHQELLKIQSETTENAYASYSANEERFKNGDITLEVYNQSLKSYNEERANKIVAETKYLKAKYALEALIGVPVEDVLGS